MTTERRPTCFLDLPGELRNIIYELVLQENHPILLQHLAPLIRDSTMATACPAIWRECTATYVSINEFETPFFRDVGLFLLWIKRERLPMPRSVRLSLSLPFAQAERAARTFQDTGLDTRVMLLQVKGNGEEWLTLAEVLQGKGGWVH